MNPFPNSINLSPWILPTPLHTGLCTCITAPIIINRIISTLWYSRMPDVKIDLTVTSQIDNAADELARAANFTKIRIFRVGKTIKTTPQRDIINAQQAWTRPLPSKTHAHFWFFMFFIYPLSLIPLGCSSIRTVFFGSLQTYRYIFTYQHLIVFWKWEREREIDREIERDRER